MADPDPRLDVYKAYFDLWTKTRQEKTEYTKYFLSLLFIDTLVAVATAVLGAADLPVLPQLTKILLLLLLAAAVAISAVWYCKLFALNVMEGSQQDMLREMEKQLFPTWASAEIVFHSEKWPSWQKPNAYHKNGKARKKGSVTVVPGMEFFQKRQGAEESEHRAHHYMWWASYWAFPIIFMIVFAVLFFALLFVPGIIPEPTATPPLKVNVSGSLNM